MTSVLKLYDAARCPYCARVRIALAEKGLVWETVEVDLSDRPAWIYCSTRADACRCSTTASCCPSRS